MGLPDQDMRVSAIPLTPVRTRERNDKKSQQPRFEDIMSERPDPSAIDHLSLPEDHLEDILA